ncbi:helix-turn-helix domain-containing protein [Verrucomicrobiota bacterium]
MGDLTLGSKLRAAREIKGVDVSTAAEKTKILPQMIRELEEDDFHRIAAPIYAKGFIRTYSDYLGIDPQPLIEEYMQKHNLGQDLKSTTEKKVAKKAKAKVPPLSELLPEIDFKNLQVNPALLTKVGIGLGVVIALVVLISLIGKCSSDKSKTAINEEQTVEQIIAEPQDVYLIKPGVMEAK